jgi:hypothetical protein
MHYRLWFLLIFWLNFINCFKQCNIFHIKRIKRVEYKPLHIRIPKRHMRVSQIEDYDKVKDDNSNDISTAQEVLSLSEV